MNRETLEIKKLAQLPRITYVQYIECEQAFFASYLRGGRFTQSLGAYIGELCYPKEWAAEHSGLTYLASLTHSRCYNLSRLYLIDWAAGIESAPSCGEVPL
jgi:hypothetical protein